MSRRKVIATTTVLLASFQAVCVASVLAQTLDSEASGVPAGAPVGVMAVAVVVFLVNTGIVGWGIWSVRKIAREEVDLVRDRLEKALTDHNQDPESHPNHPIAVEFRELVTKLAVQLASIQAKLDGVSSELLRLRESHDEALQSGGGPCGLAGRRSSDPPNEDFICRRKHA